MTALAGLTLRNGEALAAPPSPDKVLTDAEMKELLAPSPLGDQILGNADAQVTIVEYASRTCPHCAAFHAETLPKLKANYIDTGKVRLIFREYLLNDLDAGASMLSRCAPPERYFPIVDVFYQLQRGWVAANDPVAAMLAIARQVGFTQQSFEACLKNQAILDGLNKEKNRAEQRFGVNSTPTFFINGQMYRGALPFEDMEQIIAPLLRS